MHWSIKALYDKCEENRGEGVYYMTDTAIVVICRLVCCNVSNCVSVCCVYIVTIVNSHKCTDCFRCDCVRCIASR